MSMIIGQSCFYVYAIVFDQDTFGIFATREEAEESLKQQIAEDGPAWKDCEVQRWHIWGEPELGVLPTTEEEESK